MMPQERPLLEEQNLREEVANRFDCNYLVEAGAGAGKSTLIIKRIINQLLEDESPLKNKEPIQLSEIVAITFTEKAANELQYRFQKELRKRIHDERDPFKKEKLTVAFQDIDNMFISTVHSFCSKLLVEMPFYADLTIGFTPMDEPENRSFKEQIWGDFLTSDSVREGNEKSKRLREEEIAPNDLKDFFMQACDTKALGMAMDFEQSVSNPYGTIVENVKKLHQYFKGVDRSKVNKGKFSKHPYDLLEDICEKNSLKTKEKVIDFVKVLIKHHGLQDLFGKRYVDSDECQNCLSLLDLSEMKSLYQEYLQYIYHISANFVSDAIALYEATKKKQMKVSFNDLLFKTYEMLRDSREAREFFRNKYKCIYVDEFQDTDPIQTKILFLLTAENEDHEGEWINCRPAVGSLFLVGDPKQSIYRFRQADITIYDRVKRMVKSLDGWEAVSLKWNFRTNPEICEWVEDKFMLKPSPGSSEDELSSHGSLKFYLHDETKPYQTIFTGMESRTRAIEDKTDLLNGVYTYDLGELGAKETIRLDAILISNWIKDQVNGGQIYQYDHIIDQNTARDIKYGDFLILLKTTKGMITYIDKLKKLGIPVSFAGKVNLYEMHEAANLIDMISFLNDHRNTIKLVGILRNGFGIDFSTINELLPETGYINFQSLLFDTAEINELKNDGLKQAFLKINTYLQWKNEFDPITVVEKIIHDFEAVLKEQYDYINFRSAVGTLYYMLELVKQQQYISFYSLAQKFEEMKEMDIDREMPIEYDLDENGDYNCVRIMNLHKAKGLEGNIVILAKPCGDSDFPPTKHIERKDNMEHVHMCVTKKFSDSTIVLGTPPLWEEKKAEEELYSDAEKLRLLYVAATRAAKVLVISHAQNNKSPNPWELLVDDELEVLDLGDEEEDDSSVGEPIEDQVAVDKSSEKLDSAVKEILQQLRAKPTTVQELSTPTFFEISPSELEKEKKAGGTEDQVVSGEDLDAEELEELVIEPATIPYGPVWGTIVHRMFELYFIKKAKSKSVSQQEKTLVIKRAINETLEKTRLSEKVLMQLKIGSTSVASRSNQELIRKVTGSDTRFRKYVNSI
jgi:ATP-dependent helicase/nuclease subunit A